MQNTPGVIDDKALDHTTRRGDSLRELLSPENLRLIQAKNAFIVALEAAKEVKFDQEVYASLYDKAVPAVNCGYNAWRDLGLFLESRKQYAAAARVFKMLPEDPAQQVRVKANVEKVFNQAVSLKAHPHRQIPLLKEAYRTALFIKNDETRIQTIEKILRLYLTSLKTPTEGAERLARQPEYDVDAFFDQADALL